MTPAARLLALRIAAGQSHADVEKGTRLHASLVRTLEAGRPFSFHQAIVLGRHFGVPSSEFKTASGTAAEAPPAPPATGST